MKLVYASVSLLVGLNGLAATADLEKCPLNHMVSRKCFDHETSYDRHVCFKAFHQCMKEGRKEDKVSCFKANGMDWEGQEIPAEGKNCCMLDGFKLAQCPLGGAAKMRSASIAAGSYNGGDEKKRDRRKKKLDKVECSFFFCTHHWPSKVMYISLVFESHAHIAGL